MKTITLHLNDENLLERIECSSKEMSGMELFRISCSLTNILATTIAKKFPDKESRELLYNLLVMTVSETAGEIYPENEEIKGTPEDFLAHLEAKIAELKELEANVQKQ